MSDQNRSKESFALFLNQSALVDRNDPDRAGFDSMNLQRKNEAQRSVAFNLIQVRE